MNPEEFICLERETERPEAEMLGEAVFNPLKRYLSLLPPTVADPVEITIPPNLGVPWLNAVHPEPQEQWCRDEPRWRLAWN